MFRGFYAGTSAMLVQEKMLDVAANNLANVDTAGFRGRIAVNKAFPELLMEKVDGQPGEVYPPKPERWKRRELIGDMAFANVLSETALDLRGGPLRHTGNSLDVAISGEGYFVVQDGAGNVFYTRSGHFLRDGEGRLVTHDGMAVQGQGGGVEFGDASRVSIDEGGQVLADGEVVDLLRVVQFASPTYLRQEGNSLLSETETSGAPEDLENLQLASEFLEMSNVNVVSEMVRMIEANRAYESAAKTVTIQDESAGKLIQTYGRG
ncbi:MAG TPA: flagellar basal-body rod protein FlgF [Synergistaceae bacterium]|nr:flagellar basal-body rod protein FlgF [Synergistaceae bacterium]HPJ25171.1 flagellar basal-body rod protein FlgF [Synergistaceae bacterium]HPQ36757.1 flagellar basal-body rod protein FlgF [Synergistaceae bacterium]